MLTTLRRQSLPLVSVCLSSFRSCASASTSLAHEEFGSSSNVTQDSRTALVVHGLLGQGRNWRTFCKRLARNLNEKSSEPWRILTVDLRCHGESARLPGLTAPHTMEASARDLVRFVQDQLQGRSPEVVCGHSMGGKVVLEYLRQTVQPEAAVQRPEHVWVLDSQPGRVPDSVVPDVTRVIEAVQNVQLPVVSRRDFLANMTAQGFSDNLAQWMASNLVAALAPAPEGSLAWNFDVAGAAEMYSSYRTTKCWDLLAAPPNGVVVNVLRAGASDRWDDLMIAKLETSLAKAAALRARGGTGKTVGHVLEGSGHWVHFDKPKELCDLVAGSCLSLAGDQGLRA